MYSEGEGKGSVFVFSMGMRVSAAGVAYRDTTSQQNDIDDIFKSGPYIGHGVDEGEFTLDRSMSKNVSDSAPLNGLKKQEGTITKNSSKTSLEVGPLTKQAT